MDLNLCRRILPAESSRQCRYRLNLIKRTACGIVAEGRHGVAHLVDHVTVFAARMEGEVARSSTWRGGCERRVVGIESAGGRIETIYKHPVQSQVGRNEEVIRGIEVYTVDVRRFLPIWIRTLAMVIDDVAGRLKLSVC